MGHSKIAQTPGQTRNNFLPAGEGAPVGRRNGGNRGGVQHRGGEDRGNEHCAENQHPLEKVGPADRGEPAQEGVADNDDGGDIHGHRFIESDDGVEEGAAGLDARGRVDGVGNEEDGGADDLKRARPRKKPVGEVLRNGDRVVGNDREPAEPRRLNKPADGVADGKADRNPDLAQSEGVDRGGQSHEHPGAHIRGARREGGDPRAHLTAAEKITFLTAVTVLDKEIDPDGEHEEQVDDKNDDFREPHRDDQPFRRAARGKGARQAPRNGKP